MKYILLALSLFALTFFSACTKPCSQVAVVSSGSGMLASYWSCQNPKELEKWVDGLASSVGVCKPEIILKMKKEKELKGIVGSFVCPMLVEELRKMGAAQVPEAAKCDPAKIGMGAALALEAACNAIPF